MDALHYYSQALAAADTVLVRLEGIASEQAAIVELKRAQKDMERRARETAGGSNAQTREDNAAAALNPRNPYHVECAQEYADSIQLITKAEERKSAHEATVEYAKIAARAHIAMIAACSPAQ